MTLPLLMLWAKLPFVDRIDNFRYMKIQPQCEALGSNYRVCGVYSPEPRVEVYCLRLNFNVSKLVYSPTTFSRKFAMGVEYKATGDLKHNVRPDLY